MQILIVDTDYDSIEDINLLLNLNLPGDQILTINSGEQCLNIINNVKCPDIVILGMKLVDMSGLDLIKQIRDNSDVPIIICIDEDFNYSFSI